jgi:hypothetical protein
VPCSGHPGDLSSEGGHSLSGVAGTTVGAAAAVKPRSSVQRPCRPALPSRSGRSNYFMVIAGWSRPVPLSNSRGDDLPLPQSNRRSQTSQGPLIENIRLHPRPATDATHRPDEGGVAELRIIEPHLPADILRNGHPQSPNSHNGGLERPVTRRSFKSGRASLDTAPSTAPPESKAAVTGVRTRSTTCREPVIGWSIR